MHEYNRYCYHCMAEIVDYDNELCHKCGKKHSKHFCQSNELPAGTYLEEGRYFVGKSIGSGGFGITYVGFDMKLEKKILIKETFYYGLFQRNVHDPEDPNPLDVKYGREFSLEDIMRKTRKECINLSEGEGFNSIVKVYDWFTENNTAYIITEFIEGVTLEARVAQKGRYTWAEFYPKIKPLLISLSALHKKNLIHRDIKPQNIMIRNLKEMGEEFVLIDFGLARSTEKKTLASVASGFTPGYSPYEQRTFTKNDGTYTDVYAMAATIYYALTGHDPVFDMAENIEGNFPELKNMSEKYGVSQAVVQGLKFGLNPNYKQRCQSIDELMRFFDKVKLLNELKEQSDTTPFAQMNSVRNYRSENNFRTVQFENDEQGYYTQEGYAAQQGYYSQEGYEPQQEYYSQEGYEPQQGYYSQEGYEPQQGYYSQEGYEPQQGYYSQEGYEPQQGYYSQEGYENYAEEEYDGSQDNYEVIDEEKQKEYDKILKEAKDSIKAAKKDEKKGLRRFIFALFVIAVITFVIYSISSWYLHIAKAVIIVVILFVVLIIPTLRPLIKRRIAMKLLDFEKDAAFVRVFLQKAVSFYRSGYYQRTWNGRPVNEATVHDVCMENGLEDSKKFYMRKIGGKLYTLEWTGDDLKISSDDSSSSNIKINEGTFIKALAEFMPNEEVG